MSTTETPKSPGIRVVLIDRNGFAHIMGVITEQHRLEAMQSGAALTIEQNNTRFGLIKLTTRMAVYKEFA